MNATCKLPSPDGCSGQSSATQLKRLERPKQRGSQNNGVPRKGGARHGSAGPDSVGSDSAGSDSAELESAELETLGPQSGLSWFIGRFMRWRRRRAAIRELRALNDHYLTDIGLERVQVTSNLEEVIRQLPGEITDKKIRSSDRRG